MPFAWIHATLQDLRAQNLLRTLQTLADHGGARVRLGEREFLNCASNNYLDLARHPRVRAAVRDAVDRWGWGAGASQLVSGFTQAHADLCRQLANLEGTDEAVLFPSGYQANVGLITSLVGAGDRILLDKLSHASIVDGARLSGARLRVYPHGDTRKLARLLAQPVGTSPGRTLVATDSIFSMDGDLAPLHEIVDLCEQSDAMLLVDEAHATGVLGDRGSGALEWLDLQPRVPMRMGTLSKALGGIGGFVAGPAALCDLLRNRARAGIYTTAMPPAAAAAGVAALELVQNDPWRRTEVCARAASLRAQLTDAGLAIVPGPAAIVPVIVGSAETALALSARLFEDGILCPAIRPPTVPAGTSRLRISLMATHTEEDVAYVATRIVQGLQTLAP